MGLREIFGFGSKVKQSEGLVVAEPFTVISDRSVAEICGGFELEEEAKGHVGGEPAAHEFVGGLVRDGLYTDAIRFLAYALPERQAVWWACLCVRMIPACCGDHVSCEAIKAADAWVKNPTDASREAALTAGSKHKFEMPTAPAGWTAMAAGWSGGETKTEDENMPESQEQKVRHAVSGAILLAGTVEPDKTAEMNRAFLETCIEIASGKKKLF